MYWWYDPSKQKVFATKPFTSNIKNPGYFTVWPLLQPTFWTPWFGVM